jgi:hypothetical protein
MSTPKEARMFTTVRLYRCDPADAAEVAHRADEFADDIAGEPGFDGYEVVDCGDGTLITITVFDDRETAERSTEMAARFVSEKMGDISIERKGAFTGEVLVNRAGTRILELVHG